MNTPSPEMQTFTHGPQSGRDPQQAVLFLHGLGSNGRDLISLAPYFANALPDAIFISPDAPFPADMSPTGFQWFSLQEWTTESILQGLQTAAPLLETYIDNKLEHYGLRPENLVLCGFSQGTMMSLYLGPRYKETIAGVLGYSGALVWEEDSKADNLKKFPVRLIHGDADPVVPVSAYHHARETLEKAGYDVEGSITPGLAHGIDEKGIEDGVRFLKGLF